MKKLLLLFKTKTAIAVTTTVVGVAAVGGAGVGIYHIATSDDSTQQVITLDEELTAQNQSANAEGKADGEAAIQEESKEATMVEESTEAVTEPESKPWESEEGESKGLEIKTDENGKITEIIDKDTGMPIILVDPSEESKPAESKTEEAKQEESKAEESKQEESKVEESKETGSTVITLPFVSAEDIRKAREKRLSE